MLFGIEQNKLFWLSKKMLFKNRVLLATVTVCVYLYIINVNMHLKYLYMFIPSTSYPFSPFSLVFQEVKIITFAELNSSPSGYLEIVICLWFFSSIVNFHFSFLSLQVFIEQWGEGALEASSQMPFQLSHNQQALLHLLNLRKIFE